MKIFSSTFKILLFILATASYVHSEDIQSMILDYNHKNTLSQKRSDKNKGHMALDKKNTLKIYDQIFSSLVDRPQIYVFTDDKEYRDVFRRSKSFILTERFEMSDIILITSEEEFGKIRQEMLAGKFVAKKPILFSTSYRLLKRSTDIVGALYWEKGRSQLLFIKDRLKKHQIELPQEYKIFLIDEL
ncbi:MAG: hypothetical protein U9Q90_04195 [Campylobacterota bacterium]|nr:hypothetical protein [Campylobacterota bacterium]